MINNYRQIKGFFVSSTLSLVRTPTAWIFGFVFPLLFVVGFGFLNTPSINSINVGWVEGNSTDASIQIKAYLNRSDLIILTEDKEQDLLKLLSAGDLDAVVKLENTTILVYSNANRPENVNFLKQNLDQINAELTLQSLGIQDTQYQISEQVLNAREVRYIDFVLPGIIGYSIMSGAVFGVAFGFLTLRKNMVLKRIFVAPARKTNFLLGQTLSRLIYILLQNLAVITLAAVVFGYSPRNGWTAYPEIIVVMSLGILVFLSIGYLIAGIAKTEESASPLANLVVFPQLILSGTFFPVTNLPTWIATFAGLLPLTYLNQALRAVSLEGYHLWNIEVAAAMAVMLGWTLLCFGVGSKALSVVD